MTKRNEAVNEIVLTANYKVWINCVYSVVNAKNLIINSSNTLLVLAIYSKCNTINSTVITRI